MLKSPQLLRGWLENWTKLDRRFLNRVGIISKDFPISNQYEGFNLQSCNIMILAWAANYQHSIWIMIWKIKKLSFLIRINKWSISSMWHDGYLCCIEHSLYKSIWWLDIIWSLVIWYYIIFWNRGSGLVAEVYAIFKSTSTPVHGKYSQMFNFLRIKHNFVF